MAMVNEIQNNPKSENPVPNNKGPNGRIEDEWFVVEEPFQVDPEQLQSMVDKVLVETKEFERDSTGSWSIEKVTDLVRIVKKFGCYNEFYEAIMTQSTSGECCSVRRHGPKHCRSLVTMLRLFRFPFIRYANQVKSNAFCKVKFKSTELTCCMNPYHYNLVTIPRVPILPIYVNKGLNYGELPVRADEPFEEHLKWEQREMEKEGCMETEAHNITIQGSEVKILFSRYGSGITDPVILHSSFGLKHRDGDETPTPSSSGEPASEASLLSALKSMPLPSQTSQSSQEIEMDEDEEQCYLRSGLSSPASNIASPDVFVPKENYAFSMQNGVVSNKGTEQNGNNADENSILPIEPRPLYRSSPSELGSLVRKATVECVEYQENPYWIRLMYYEESEKIGESRQFSSQHCLVDGYSSSSESTDASRFSVGFYTNPKRTLRTSEVRNSLGNGVRVYLLAGEVYMENLGVVPVFVQSLCANLRNNFPMNTVSKIPVNGSMKVFDMQVFSKKLNEMAAKTYQEVYCLNRLCTIRLSFCKGWGEHYRRSTVLSSPVWFQIHLNNPMAWIDRVLTCMGAPPRLCSSRT
uniref:Dwarfin sma n=2 Tax=Caenorhabditis tropicalis TaxID=1561998 RepID=A0A1I7UXX9_9PELO